MASTNTNTAAAVAQASKTDCFEEAFNGLSNKHWEFLDNPPAEFST
jgi:hypothetical protein